MKVPPSSTSSLKGIVQQNAPSPSVMMPPSLDDESSSSSSSSTISAFPDDHLNKSNTTTATKSDKSSTKEKVDASESMTKKTKEKKHVRFDENANKSYENADYYKDELKERWYSRHDRRQSRDDTKQWAKRIYIQQVHEGGMLRNPNGYYSVLRRIHKTCRDLSRAANSRDKSSSKSGSSVLSTNDGDATIMGGSIISTTCYLTDKEKECLQWPGLVGMELMNSYDHSNLIRYQQVRRFQTLRAVSYLQHKYSKSKSKSSTSDDTEMDVASEKAEVIRKTCEKVSLPARLFATHLAQAQATYDD